MEESKYNTTCDHCHNSLDPRFTVFVTSGLTAEDGSFEIGFFCDWFCLYLEAKKTFEEEKAT